VAWLSGQDDLLEAFAQGRDTYSEFASVVFGRTVTKGTREHPPSVEDVIARFLGKTSILGLGYSMGSIKFHATIKTQSRLQLGQAIEMDEVEAARIVGLYRSTYTKIASVWKLLNMGIEKLASGKGSMMFGPCKFEHQAVLLPSGLRLFYEGLEEKDTEKGKEWVFTYGKKPKRLYGGKLLENISQALAGAHVADVMRRMRRRGSEPHWRFAMQVHDELIYVVPDGLVDEFKELLVQEMSTPAEWGAGLPLAAEAGSGLSYGEAK
jgi:DNA polymerase